jgi:hypothetical protein
VPLPFFPQYTTTGSTPRGVSNGINKTQLVNSVGRSSLPVATLLSAFRRTKERRSSCGFDGDQDQIPVPSIHRAFMAMAAAIAIVWPMADLIAVRDVGAVVGTQRTQQLLTAREVVRTQLLTLGAGVFAAGALVFTARNTIFAQRTVQLTEQGQVTDRYTTAVEQLGSDSVTYAPGESTPWSE